MVCRRSGKTSTSFPVSVEAYGGSEEAQTETIHSRLHRQICFDDQKKMR
jgi:hypothetical protein